MVAESSARAKVLSCGGLVVISTLVGILYKLSQAATGGFKYSTTSAITIAECVKLTLSVSFCILDKSSRSKAGAVASAWASMVEQLSLSALANIWLLSCLYTINNQLSFFVYTLADPGTVFLFKSASTLIVALIQCVFAGKSFTGEQWRAMGLQACGMIIVQYDPCTHRPMYEPQAYLCMCLSAVITAICAARNEYIVKNYAINLNVQNAALYAGGVWMNLVAFFLLPNPNSAQAAIGFFEGYDNPLALGVVFANSLIGLAITAVYKYADAVIKCIAADITAVILCIFSVCFFGLNSTITLWCGVTVVCFAVHLYTGAGKSPAAPPKAQDQDALEEGEGKKGPMDSGGSLGSLTRNRSWWIAVLSATMLLGMVASVFWNVPLQDAGLMSSNLSRRDSDTAAVDARVHRCLRELVQKAQEQSLAVELARRCLENLSSDRSSP